MTVPYHPNPHQTYKLKGERKLRLKAPNLVLYMYMYKKFSLDERVEDLGWVQ